MVKLHNFDCPRDEVTTGEKGGHQVTVFSLRKCDLVTALLAPFHQPLPLFKLG